MSDSQKYLNDFYRAAGNGLKHKLGCVLFQFAPQFEYTEERLESLTTLLNGTFNNVVEFRHPSWWNSTVYNAFANTGVVFCGMSHPKLPDAAVSTGSTSYYRFHGVPHLYTSKYLIKDLEAIATELMKEGSIRESYILFNNTMDGAALSNAKDFQGIVELVH